MSGGLLTATDIMAGPGTASFNFDGGEIVLTGDRTSIVNEPWFHEVAGTQAVYDAQSNLTHVTVVPEPSSAVLAAASVVFLGFRRRRNSMAC